MKILIGIDGSDGAFAATEFVGHLLNPAFDEVVFYYAPPQLSSRGVSADLLERARQSLADNVFRETVQRLPEPMRTKTRLVIGTQKPHHGLIVVADEERVDLIVVGARGVGPIERLMLGSVSRAVVHAANLPVLVVRGQVSPQIRVLLACDRTEASEYAAKMLGKFHWPQNASGRVITVVESLLVGEVPEWLQQQARDSETEAMAKAWVLEHEEERKRTEQELRSYCDQLPPIFHGKDPIVVEGHPSQEILKTAQAENVDLVVTGARGLGTFSRMILGSTSEKILTQAPCSVLIARQHEKP